MPDKNIKIAVISGGLSNEREVSLKSGQQVYANLPEDKYEKHHIEIMPDGRWLLQLREVYLKLKKASIIR